MTPGAVALRPLAPAHARAQRVETGIRLDWIRRSRIDADSWAAQEIPLGEAAERYVVDIRADGETVRSIETAMPQALYSADDEIADFGAPQSQINVRIAQVSATVGRGIPLDVTLEL